MADWERTYWYVYRRSLNDSVWIYERTCGTEEAAKVRVAELKLRFPDAKYQTDLLEGAFI